MDDLLNFDDISSDEDDELLMLREDHWEEGDSPFEDEPSHDEMDVDLEGLLQEMSNDASEPCAIMDSDDAEDDAVAALEDLSIRFLSLLSDALPSPPDDQSDEEDQRSTTDVSTKSNSRARRKSHQIELEIGDARKGGRDGEPGTRIIRFPRRMKPPRTSAKPLVLLMLICSMGLAYCSDIFYQDTALFGSQSVVDKLVDDLAATLDLPRAALNIVRETHEVIRRYNPTSSVVQRASPKGLFASSAVTINLASGGKVQGRDFEGSLIPVSEDISRFNVEADLRWVLVVEKEAVFQTLCAVGFPRSISLPGSGLIITGKGYPDLATRHFVTNLVNHLPPSVPILALMDADPYGIDILSIYTHCGEGGAANRVKWIGVWGTEWQRLGIDNAALLPLTDADHKKAVSMLRQGADTMPAKWKKELTHMLFTQRKAEIQILSTPDSNSLAFSLSDEGDVSTAHVQAGGALVSYLVSKLRSNLDMEIDHRKVEDAIGDLLGLNNSAEDVTDDLLSFTVGYEDTIHQAREEDADPDEEDPETFRSLFMTE